MLEYYLKSVRPLQKISYSKTTPTTEEASREIKSIFNEGSRRNAIIKTLFQECKYKPGDNVWPADKEAREKYGECYVEKILSSYAQMGKDEKWPSSDVPMIVSAYSKKMDYHFICTTNFLVPYNKDGSIPS